MFIIFDWEKTTENLGAVCISFCFDCRKKLVWDLGKMTEWVSFFDIKTIPFLNRYFLVCSKCGDYISLSGSDYWKIKRSMKHSESINDTPIHKKLSRLIKKKQLADKTETQLKYIQAAMEDEGIDDK